MPPGRTPKQSRAAMLAAGMCDALQRDRVVPRFVDTYVVEHGRYALQVHPTRYRELLDTIGREALLAMAVRALDVHSGFVAARKPRPSQREAARAVRMFRQQFLAALTRQQNWSAGDALEFQADLALYESLGAASQKQKRQRRFGSSQGPFVDRCAFLLDPSLMEQARAASGKLLLELERLADVLVEKIFHAA